MKKRVLIFLLMITCISILTACGGNKQAATREAWDKSMRDTYAMLTKADANYKMENTTKSFYGESQAVAVTDINIVDGNKSSKENSLSVENKTFYEIVDGTILNSWVTTGGFIINESSATTELNTMGAYVTQGINPLLNNLSGAFDFFTFAGDKYSVTQDCLETFYNEVMGADELPLQMQLTDFFIELNNGLISRIEYAMLAIFSLTSELEIPTTVSINFTYGGQSVVLPR